MTKTLNLIKKANQMVKEGYFGEDAIVEFDEMFGKGNPFSRIIHESMKTGMHIGLNMAKSAVDDVVEGIDD